MTDDLRNELGRMYRGDDPHTVTPEELEKLPLLALVAFAARCARRVQPFLRTAHDDPHAGRVMGAIENAVAAAERVACGLPVAPDEIERCATAADRYKNYPLAQGRGVPFVVAEAARAAAEALAGRADRVVNHAATAMSAGAQAIPITAEEGAAEMEKLRRGALGTLGNDRFREAVWRDYSTLLELNLGTFPDPGRPIGEPEAGRLGPVW